MTVTVKIQKLRDVPLPAYMTPGAAAMDVAAAIDAPVTLPPHTPVMLPLGFAIALPEGYVGLRCGRSAMGANDGVCRASDVGVMASDYRGELRMTLINHTDAPVTVEPGQRVGQLMVLPVGKVTWEECETLPETARGAGSYG